MDLGEETGVRLSQDVPPTANVLVRPGAAEQIIDNLIDNAPAVAPAGWQLQLVVSVGNAPEDGSYRAGRQREVPEIPLIRSCARVRK